MIRRKKSFLFLTASFLSLSLWACVPGNATITTSGSPAISTEDPATSESITKTEIPSTEAETERYVLNEGSPLATLPLYPYDSYSDYWNVENGAEMLIFNAESADGYEAYLQELLQAGFTLYAENEIAGNLYSSWTSETIHVTTMYLPALNHVRILAEPSSVALPLLESENIYTDAGLENMVIQIGANFNGTTTNGMCYIYRLGDGSFILVDANYGEPGCADEIYNALVKYAPDPENIVIAAWFITHPHCDHIDGFHSFNRLFKDKVTVEQVIYNFPTERSFIRTSTTTDYILWTAECCASYGCRVVEAHPGQEFYIRDAYIEMLYTPDLYSRKDIDYMNNSSLVFRVTLADTTIMHTGDCGPLASPIVLKLYGEYLDSDILQVIHHGGVGASAALNQAINPEVLLYPSTSDHISSCFWQSYNSPFREIEHVYPGDALGTMIPLPFDASRVESWEIFD